MRPPLPRRPQPLRAVLAAHAPVPPPTAFTRRERALVDRLRTPAAVQRWLNALPYNQEAGGET
ncbi:MAG: hypothetical protein AB7U83_22375, partial [Vicinamibacterales bacterium]